MEWSAPHSSIAERDPPPVAKKGDGPDHRALKRRVENLIIRVPRVEWANVSLGVKEMFRTYHPGGIASDYERRMLPVGVELPRPVLLASHINGSVAAPAILLEHRHEPLGTITENDLHAEGFEYLPAFRYYWKRRYQTIGWRPWSMVNVFRVRPWVAKDDEWVSRWLVDQLYGEWMEVRQFD